MGDVSSAWSGPDILLIVPAMMPSGRGDAVGSYLKDWHFVRDCPGAAAYSTPAPFADDWLNWWWTERRGGEDDYRFVYLGPSG